MKILFVYPKYPSTYWSFSGVLHYIDKKAIFPPLGLLTIASMVPEDWEKKLVDANVSALEDDDIDWADMVFISAMIVQKEDAITIIERCKKANKIVVAGGPIFTTMHEDFEQLGVDYFVLDEGEITLPLFLEDLANGNAKHIYHSSERPDISTTPVPLWSLINVNDYYGMVLQFSRGCPFNCEFCDIVIMNGRIPRTKSPSQVLTELQAIFDLGFRGFFFIVDDNFIGNKIKVKELLAELIIWQKERNYPFHFLTEASLNLAADEELMELMAKANFKSVFLGIETPSIESLKECGKLQNTKEDLIESVKKIQGHGMMVMGGFIVGFDSDTESIFDAQIDFIQRTGITTAMVGMLGALPKTQLWYRLEKEGRLFNVSTGENTNGSLNFLPKMGVDKLLAGYSKVLSTIYSPKYYYQRLSTLVEHYTPQINSKKRISKAEFKSFLRSMYLIGVKSSNRFRFWKLLIHTLIHKPEAITLAVEQIIYGEHFEKVTESTVHAIKSNKYHYELHPAEKELQVGTNPPELKYSLVKEVLNLR
ncbi:MAG TPA: B12-binding domain-containing radical SAM protein [Candidatus Lokiarchaeia archaeon]|nr:B12-binding domain-containing radical SAM protein [Candidatus Lokiarchaeia archaeon]